MEDPKAPKLCHICGVIHLSLKEMLPEGWRVLKKEDPESWGLVAPNREFAINIQPTKERAQHYFPMVIRKWEDNG